MAPSSKATQDFVPIHEVRDGYVILKDGSMRAILMTSSLNFALKSQEEQESILYQFQSFLNSLDFSIQIFVQSRKLDIRPYLALLEARRKEQVNDLMKIQTQEYIEFVRQFTENTSIMTKTFFVVIPYTPPVLNTKKQILGRVRKQGETEKDVQDRMAKFEESRSQLEERIAVVEQGLVRSGVRVVPLGTEEIVELFYKIFNPGDTEKPIQLDK
jgi:type IV secretory pathway VirB4 component